jgi:hypothetical protein
MTHTEYANGLREVANFLEAHPEIELPESELNCYRLDNKETAATTARALSHGGRCDKSYEDTLVRLKRTFGPITLQYLGCRSEICEQVRVGTRIVPEQYVAPKPATEAQVIPEHEEAVYEWHCPPMLSKPGVEIPEEQPASMAGSISISEAEYHDIPF